MGCPTCDHLSHRDQTAPMSHLFHRHCHATLPVAIGGEGPYVFDQSGKRYLDACGGAAVCCLGYGHPAVLEAIHKQVESLAYVHSSFFTTEAAEALGDKLAAMAPPGIERSYLVTGGSEAVEAALKLARQYFLERGEPQRRHFIARRQSYHGNTLGALAVGGNAWRREAFQPLLVESHHIAPCYAYRDQRTDESKTAYGLRVANELEAKIEALGAENVIGFIAETVVGATAGAVPPVPGYFKRIHEICDHHGILLILDEVMCGMGRTGSLFACEQENVVPDLITIAKGLGAGYQPIGALLASDEIYATVRDGSGFFQHGHTYMGHATACAASLAVLGTIEQESLLEQVRLRGRQLTDALHERFDTHTHVGDIRGRGLFIGLELVANRETREPFDPALGFHRAVKKAALAQGLMIYPMGGTIDGQYGDHILLAPPFIIDETHLGEIVEKLGTALDTSLAR